MKESIDAFGVIVFKSITQRGGGKKRKIVEGNSCMKKKVASNGEE